MTGEIDRRLLDIGAVTAVVIASVLDEHNCARGAVCPACGYEPTRKQRVCRSVAVARGLRVGRAPRWAGDEPTTEQASDPGTGQGALFDLPSTPAKAGQR